MRKKKSSWVIYFVPGNNEKRFVSLLKDKKIETFFPIITITINLSGKKKVTHIPFMAGYVFVELFGKELSGTDEVRKAVRSLIYFNPLKEDRKIYVMGVDEIQMIRDATAFQQQINDDDENPERKIVRIGSSIKVDDKYRGGIFKNKVFLVIGISRKHAILASSSGICKIPLFFLSESGQKEIHLSGSIGKSAR